MGDNMGIYGRRRTTTLQQLEMLIEFAEANKEMSLGQLRNKEGRVLAERLWRQCAKKLNSKGPPRLPKEWTKIWNDMKSRVRSKIQTLDKIRRGILDENLDKVSMTSLEWRVGDLLGLPKALVLQEESPNQLPVTWTSDTAGSCNKDFKKEASPEARKENGTPEEPEDGNSSKDANSDSEDDDEMYPASSLCTQLEVSQNNHYENNELLEKEYQDRKKREDEICRLRMLLLKEKLREAKAKADLAELMLAKKRDIRQVWMDE